MDEQSDSSNQESANVVELINLAIYGETSEVREEAAKILDSIEAPNPEGL
jgi:hypothetical protein